MKQGSKIALMVLIVAAAIVSCTNSLKEKVPEFNYDHAKIPNYLAITDSLKPYGYVPLFRTFKKINFDFETYNLSGDESQYLIDSVAYYKAREVFFNQDEDFLYWLIGFKNDTLVDSTTFQRSLYSEFTNPYLSSLPQCSFNTSKSKQAINLVFGYLNGSELKCIEHLNCQIGNPTCAIETHEFVEAFLREHPSLNIEELRKVWSKIDLSDVSRRSFSN